MRVLITAIFTSTVFFSSVSYAADWDWKIIEIKDQNECSPGDKPDEMHQVRMYSNDGREEIFRTECYDSESEAYKAINRIMNNIDDAKLPTCVGMTCPPSNTP